MNYRTFVKNLNNLNQYKEDSVALKTELDSILYVLSGVRGLSYDQVLVRGNPSVSEEKRLELIDRYDAKEKEFQFVMSAIRQIEEILGRMPSELQNTLIEIYVHGKTFHSVGVKYGYSAHGMWSYLKKETERYL